MSVENVAAIKGTVRRGTEPLEGAYVTLMDPTKDFLIAERRTGPDGTFSFHTTPGRWVLVCRASGSKEARQEITADPGESEVGFVLS